MENLILEPLKFYEQVGKETHTQHVQEHFDTLVKKSGIDVQENRKTSALYRKQLAKAEATAKRIKRYKVFRGLLIALAVIGFIVALIGLVQDQSTKVFMISLGSLVGIGSILFILLKLNKLIKSADKLYIKQQEEAQKTLQIALSQTSVLNSLFTEKDVINLIEKTVPNLKFDNNYSVSLQNDLKTNFDFNDGLGECSSVLDTLSGRYNENPFLFSRYLHHYMGVKTYHGSLVISWTETRRDADGKLRTVVRSQTLVASVTKPFPYYTIKTGFAYGHQSAPDLNFKREATDVEELNDKQVEKRVKKGSKEIKKREEKSVETGGKFTAMTNEQFDVIFGALDRDNEVQFRVLFSPLAQVNMLKLLRSKVGYGDDFSFTKRGKVNYIISEHAQRWDMDTSPKKYCSYDVDLIKENFLKFNQDYFKAVFFDFAPVLTIPSYHGQPSLTFEPLKNSYHYTDYEYEVMANLIGRNKFSPPTAQTESILKTEYMSSQKDSDSVMVTASAYSGSSRVDFIPVLGGDGKMHAVPVHWVEYFPVQKQTVMMVKELGVDREQFNAKAQKSGVADKVFGSTSAYYHGLFAKIIDHEDLVDEDSALDKIKNI